RSLARARAVCMERTRGGDVAVPDGTLRRKASRSATLASLPHAPGRNRTFNLGIKSPLLCQLSYGRDKHKPSNIRADAVRDARRSEGERGDLNPRPPGPQPGALTTC